jgi:site-specific recombinase XerD
VEFWAQRVQTTVEGRPGWVVVDDRYDSIDDIADFLWVLQHGRGRSDGTAKAYAGRLALFLTWAHEADVDWRRPTPVQLTVFMGWLTRTPSRQHRQGRRRRRAPAMAVRCDGPQRSPGTVNGVLTAVVEFLRFLGAYEVIDEDVPGRLSKIRRVRVAAGEGWNENPSRVVDARLLRQRHTPASPQILTVDAQDKVRAACRNERDRFLVELLAGTGMRVGEACGLRLEDLHFLPSSTMLGCDVVGGHVHVRRRIDNENGAMAKSWRERSIPIGARIASAYSTYRLERDRVPVAADSDFVFVNLYRQPLGRAMSMNGVEELFGRLSTSVGFRVRPHMLRHSFASAVAARTKDPAIVKELLGHASVTSTDVYLHAHWDELRAAVASVSMAVS